MLDPDLTKNKADFGKWLREVAKATDTILKCPKCGGEDLRISEHADFTRNKITVQCLKCNDEPREISREELDRLISK